MTETKRTYYRLPTDQYGQPTGEIVPIVLTESEFKANRQWMYLFEDYESALYRAQD